MKIYYGIIYNKIDVTDICLSKLNNNNIVIIPIGDQNRDRLFTDPLPNIHKKIFILNNDETLEEYDEFYEIKINLTDNTITSNEDIEHKLHNIQKKLKINHGSFIHEHEEQKMAVKYLTGHEKVLEIGGNIGRNSLIIAAILNNNNNYVTLESDKDIASQLRENRDLNNFNFHIENSALSKRKLIQKVWNSFPSDILQEGYHWVNTITFDELKTKYNIDFDTLILDCEGAFYYILMDMPEILDNVNLIIMENDYFNISEYWYIIKILKEKGFYVDYVKDGGWGLPCANNFFEVWKK